jgi:hypothetical protein
LMSRLLDQALGARRGRERAGAALAAAERGRVTKVSEKGDPDHWATER